MSYRYVETEKVDGKTARTGGSTRRSLRALKHLPKIGTVQYVRGYVYKGRYGAHAGVLVRGTLGSIRFGGFAWGYNGEGPRGLERLFDALNVPEWARRFVWRSSWPRMSEDEVGEHWRITFGSDGQTIHAGLWPRTRPTAA
jgi:hypothetical protein